MTVLKKVLRMLEVTFAMVLAVPPFLWAIMKASDLAQFIKEQSKKITASAGTGLSLTYYGL